MSDGWSRWPAPAKLNLFLQVTGRRADGYHLLQTVFQLLDWGDEIGLRTRQDGLVTRTTDAYIAEDEDLAVRAARLLQQSSGTRHGVDIAVTKRIPVGGGFGGGSSDAATVLVVLNRLWSTGLTLDELARLGATLGADVPVFVRGRSAWGEGIGDLVTPLELGSTWYLVVDAGLPISTAELFRAPDLTRDAPFATIADFVSGHLHGNAFEPVLRRRVPELEAAMNQLGRLGRVQLTGTGSGLFVAFDSQERATAARHSVPSVWRSWVVEGVDVSPLHRALGAGTV